MSEAMRDRLPIWEPRLDEALGLKGQPPEVIELVHRARMQGFEFGEDSLGKLPADMAPRDGLPVFFVYKGGFGSDNHGGQWGFCWVEGKGWVQHYRGSFTRDNPSVLQDAEMDYWIPVWTASERNCDVKELLP